jgi:hypothetical protein
MSAQFELVSAIIAKARKRADVEGQDDRHPAADDITYFNESCGELRVRLTNLGFEWFLESTTAAALPTTAAATGETYAEVDWPLDAQRIYRFDVLFQTGLWLPLRAVTIGGLRDYQQFHNFWDVAGIADGPCAFALRKAPFGSAAVETVGKLMVVPVPTTARLYKLWYLRNYAAMATTDTFNGHASFSAWIVQDMVIKYSERDNDSQATYGIAVQERARLENLLAQEAPKTQMSHADIPRRIDGMGYDDWSPRMVP